VLATSRAIVPERLESTGGVQFPQQCSLVEVVDKGPFAVDLDHREPFPVAPLELRIRGDVDDLVLDPEAGELLFRAFAEAAALRDVDDDPRDRARG
jgi:hypothetical protein